ncbi:hypothetical protein PINS_up000594 [Pythium insidiosum]|nr:hypothetical protein PINS_up000594 [Pythium insidiosum]
MDKRGGSKSDAVPQRAAAVNDQGKDDDDDGDEAVESYTKATRKSRRVPGATYMDLEIAQIGLKDAKIYVNPTVVVSVFGASIDEEIHCYSSRK